jgi:hypothetical protein
MASFPQWHRLFVMELELQLTYVGARVGVPYWDWTQSFTELPHLVTQDHDNPFYNYHIQSVNHTTSRAPRPQLYKDPTESSESFFYTQVSFIFLLLRRPSLWRNRLDMALTADQKVWGSIPTRATAK